jgi:hypothetical protein
MVYLQKVHLMSCVIHINGWPGSGKRSIGTILAAEIGGKLLDCHVMLNPAEALFERNDPLHAELLDAVRSVTLDYAAKLAQAVSIILTDPLSDDASDTAVFERYRNLATRRGARLISVTLEIEAAENVRRLETPSRAEHRKLTRATVLRELWHNVKLLQPEGTEAYSLDVTHLTASEAAARISTWVTTPARSICVPNS